MLIEEKKYAWRLISLLGIFWLYRLFVLFNAPYDLYFDEAYYYNWAQNPDWGYYSKPPMLGWLIWLTTSIFGDSQVAIKIGAMLLYPLTTFVIYCIARELFDPKTAFYSALIFFTLPSVWMSSLIISTDVVLLFFWSLALLFFIKAIYHDRARDWIFAGIFSGFGLMSKYNFIFFLISVILVLALVPKYRKYFTNKYLYLSMLVAFVIFLPNLIWNYNHDFVSFTHTQQISHVTQQLIHPNKFFEFFGAQFLVFGPILFFFYWVIVFKRAFLKNDSYLILFLFSITTLGFIMILSFISRSFANWAAVTYVSATILVVAYLLKSNKENLLKLSVVIHTLLAVVFFHYHALADMAGVELTRKTDPYKRVSGWHDISKMILKEKEPYPDTLLLADGRAEVAQFDYYTKMKTYIFNPKHEMDNHYHLTRDLNDVKGKDFFFVSKDTKKEALLPYFDKVEKIGRVNKVLYSDFNRTYTLFYLKNFKGY
jgi:4-amino-4-deoxy-L-arabinose transferase-like glycosyltransferase